MRTGSAVLLALSLAGGGLSGCGGRPGMTQPAEASATGGDATGAERAPEDMEAGDAEWSVPGTPLDEPRLTVRVDGPDLVSPDVLGGADTAIFETRVLIINTGTRVAEVGRAEVRFEAWSEDDERSECVSQGEPAAPPPIEPGETHELYAAAVCEIGGAGPYEIRTYVAFEAFAEDGSLSLGRHYAGRRILSLR